MTTKTAVRNAERADAVDRLRGMYPVGATVQTKLLHVSQSGMLRSFAVLVSAPGSDQIRDVSHLVAKAIGAKVHAKTGGVAMGGAGMDMGFALAYSLSRALFAGGFHCTGGDYSTDHPCPSNDHANERGQAPYTSGYSTDRVHSDPGYALNHRHI